MTLTHKSLMALSKFAIKAKKHIGIVKAAEMFNDHQYACDILIQATLSDDVELIGLTKEISSEFNADFTLISSVESYINALKIKNCTEEFIHESKYFLVKLTHHLYGLSFDGTSYRQAVDKLLSKVDAKEKTFCINLAREFYQFWRNANRSHTEINNEHALKISTQKEEFIKLWANIEDEFFSDAENWSLTLYAESMKQISVSEKDINISQKIAKVITVELRNDVNQFEENYRNAINNIQHLFSSPEMKEFFLIVSREYYHFWISNTPKNTSH